MRELAMCGVTTSLIYVVKLKKMEKDVTSP